jgi:Fur family transcriptional regulator, ferric uptake regulator
VALPAVEVSQSPEDKYREYLASRPRPQRYTDQQRDMVRYIFAQHNHFDADQLVDNMKRDGFHVSRSTIYRTLDKLVDAGLLRSLEVGPRMYYEHDYGYPQHEHLFCEQCKKMIEFQNPAIEAVVRDVCRQNGFQSAGHSFIIRGVCAECNRARVTKRRLDLV